jgi:hypothetical protein
MAQGAFAMFFLLSLAAGLVALARLALHERPRVIRALLGIEASGEAARVTRIEVCATADVPRIADRLRRIYPSGLAPVRRVPRAWPFERSRV